MLSSSAGANQCFKEVINAFCFRLIYGYFSFQFIAVPWKRIWQVTLQGISEDCWFHCAQ